LKFILLVFPVGTVPVPGTKVVGIIVSICPAPYGAVTLIPLIGKVYGFVGCPFTVSDKLNKPISTKDILKICVFINVFFK
jgi:hypothetical protein